MSWTVLVCALSLAWGCAASTGESGTSRPKRNGSSLQIEQPFPAEERLEAISKEAPPELAPEKISAPLDVATWTIDDPTPTRIGSDPPADADTLAKAVQSALRKNPDGRVVTTQIQCVAREHARFRVRHGGEPPRDIALFIAARCGAPTIPEVATWTLPREPGQKVPAPTGPEGVEWLGAALPTAPPDAEVGMAVGVAEKEIYVILAWREKILDLRPIEMVVRPAVHVELRGTLSWLPEWISAYATKGPLGYSRCRPIHDQGIQPPEFAFKCPVDPRDDHALLSISAAPRGALLGSEISALFVSPDGTMPALYETRVGSLPVNPQDHSPASYLAAINTLRDRAGAGPLKLSAPQGDVVTSLLPHLLAARAQDDHRLADELVLGMIAGYRVGDTIRDARFASGPAHLQWQVERAIASEIMLPASRESLLNPDLDVLAVGMLQQEARNLRTIAWCSYELFENRSFAEEERAVLNALDAHRADLGRPPVLRVEGPNDRRMLDAAAERIRQGESDPSDELDALLESFADATRHEFRGRILLPMRIDGWTPDFGEHLTQVDHLAVAIKIGYFRPVGAPWGQHLVMLIYTELPGPPPG